MVVPFNCGAIRSQYTKAAVLSARSWRTEKESSHFPNFGWVKSYGLRQFYRECCDLIVWVYMLRGVTKQRDVQMIAIHFVI